MEHTERHRISRGVYRSLILSFCRTLGIYIGSIVVLALGAYTVLRMQVWYAWDPVYPVLHWLHENIAGFLIFLTFIGVIFISCFSFYRIAKLMEEMTGAVDMVYKGTSEELVTLPESLREVEMQLNQIMLAGKENRNQMEQLQRQKNDLIMYMAHDLKTPLTSVIGYLTLLTDEKEISEKTRQHYLEIALQKSYRLEDLINEFFDITRIGYSDIILSKASVNLSRMLEQILYEFKPVFEQKGLRYKLDCTPEIMANIDVEQMQRVFDNLLKNIVNYSYPETEVEVFLQIENETICCTMVNHGETIPKEKLSHIFEQFYRMDSARESQTGGSGLGLAIVKRIVELHGGSISCESEDERIRFLLRLPIG